MMIITPFDVLRALFMFGVVSVLLTEVIGYFWHRLAEHNGWLGETVRYHHWIHHEQDYPVHALRPAHPAEYKSAGSWTWYVLAGISIVALFLLIPLRDAVPITIGGVLYAWYVVNYFHESFHLEKCWLQRFPWFKRLTRLHDIHHWVQGNYGIVFFWMDKLCGTYVPDFPQPLVQQENFPGRA